MLKKIIAAVVMALGVINLALAAVNINTASQAELESLPGIGPVKAKAILEDRKKNGNYKSVDDLKRVSGIGDKTVVELKDKITVSGGDAKPVSATPASAGTVKKADAKK